MAQKLKLEINAAGRKVPLLINGKKSTPYKGVGKFSPLGNKYFNNHIIDSRKNMVWYMNYSLTLSI